MLNVVPSSTLPLLTSMIGPATHHHEWHQEPHRRYCQFRWAASRFSSQTTPPPSSFQVSCKIKAFQRLHFSSPSSFINIQNHISPSALADVVYQNGPIPERDRMTRVRSHVRCSKFRACRHGKVGTQAAGILTPTRPRSGWELPEEISYLYCCLNR